MRFALSRVDDFDLFEDEKSYISGRRVNNLRFAYEFGLKTKTLEHAQELLQ